MFQFKNKKFKNLYFFVDAEQRKKQIQFKIEKTLFVPDAQDNKSDLQTLEVIYFDVAKFAVWHAAILAEGWNLCKE